MGVGLGKDKRKGKVAAAHVVERPKIPFALLVRMFLVGSIAVGAAAWAIHRHYSVPRPSMLEPAPSATEIPAPELDPSR